MKTKIFILVMALGFAACSTKWEYKTVTVKGKEDEALAKYQSRKFDVSDSELNIFGKSGWELVDVYEKTETVHPNFGNDEYVSGLQPNVRTAEINFVFKRKK